MKATTRERVSASGGETAPCAACAPSAAALAGAAAGADGSQGTPSIADAPLTRSDLTPSDGTGNQAAGSPPLVSALAFGLFLSWVYLACFSSKLFPADGATSDLAPFGQIVSFAGYLAWVAVCVVRYRHLTVRWGGRMLAMAGLAALGTVGVAASSFLPDAASAQVLLGAAAIATGLGTGCLLVSWVLLFVHGRWHVPLQVGAGLLVSFLVTSVVLLLPFPAATCAIVLLPAASGLCILFASRRVPFDADAPEPAPEPPADPSVCRMPPRLVLGLSAMGLVYGLAYGFAFAYAPTGIEASVSCLAVNAIVGGIVIVYAVRWGKNIGYSAFNLAILPAAGFAQCVLAVFQTDYLPVAFFIMRLAYVLFDVMLWLQLPKVYERIGTVRTFLVSRLVLEGSTAVGIVARELLAYTGFQVFGLVALAALAYLLIALTLAFRGESVGNVWDLMPEQAAYTGKFRRACASITEEYGLTQRESEVMGLVMRGRSGTFVQDKLFISKSTFQTHMRNLYHKLDVHSNQELLDLLERTLDEEKEGNHAANRT